MQFTQIVGQESIKANLLNIVKRGRVAHSMLFVEKPGYGALPLAVALATYILCSNRSEGDSCGKCSNCLLTKKLSHPDLHFSMPINSGGAVKKEKKLLSDSFLESWRTIFLSNPYLTYELWSREIAIESKVGFIGVDEASSILSKLNLRSFSGGEKFVIIWLPESMNREAANRLLKFFEEPPLGTHIFMVTHSPEKLLPTILSRCQIVMVPPIDSSVMAKTVEEQFLIEDNEAASVVKRAAGSLSRAREVMQQSEATLQHDREINALINGAIERDFKIVMDCSERLAMLDKEEQRAFINYSLEYIRAILVTFTGAGEIADIPSSRADNLIYLSKKLNFQQLLRVYKLLNEALHDLNGNVNSKYLFANLSNRFYLYLK